MVDVIAWPPVGAIGTEWTEEAPVQISRSMVTGAERLSAFQRKRRLATLTVPGIGKNTYDAGYIEILKRYLAGVNCVRLYSYPVNWHFESGSNADSRQSVPLLWSSGGVDLLWSSGGVDLLWYSGTVLYGTTATVSSRPVVNLTGLPPNTLVARPGEFLTIYDDTAPFTDSETLQIALPATSDGSGNAQIVLFDTPAASYTGGRVNLGTRATGVFRPIGVYPRAVQPETGNWSYPWQFREVFEDEVGTFTEVNPWVL